MKLVLISGAGLVLWLIGSVTMVVSLVGTRRPRGPASRIVIFADRVWRGTGRTARVRRRHRAILVSGLIAGVLAWLFTGVPVAGALVAFAVPAAPWLFQVGQAERAAIERVEAVGEWARRLKDVSVTGVGLQQAIVVSAAAAPTVIAEEVRDLSVRLHAGVDARDALARFADAIGDPVCDQVVAALILHLSDRGDRLGEVLTSIAYAASAEVATRREVDAKRTQSRFGVRFLTITTFGTLAYGAIRPGYMRPYETPLGELVLTVLGALFVGILVWTRSMSQPERAPRFLRSPGLDGPRRGELP
jgi:Flp pilus assembly protein TadB